MQPQSIPVLTHDPVSRQSEDTRADFLLRVYAHIGVALAAFFAVEMVMFMSGFAETLYDLTFGSGQRFRWLLVIGGFAIVSSLATRAAHEVHDPAKQYAGLFGLAIGEAILFAPMLWLAKDYEVTDGANTIATAGVVSLVGFAGLTVLGLVTRRDLSPMRRYIGWGMMLALALIVGAVVFGFNLGLWFSVAMVGLAGASILTQTQAVMRSYPANAHVGAATQLFASMMLLFWYVLRIFLRFSSRD